MFFFPDARSKWLTFSEFSKFPIQSRLGVSVKSVYEKASSLSWSLWGCLSVLWQPLIFLFKPTETSQSHTLNTCTKGVMWFDVRLWAWMCNCKRVFWSIQSWPVFYSGGEWGSTQKPWVCLELYPSYAFLPLTKTDTTRDKRSNY